MDLCKSTPCITVLGLTGDYPDAFQDIDNVVNAAAFDTECGGSDVQTDAMIILTSEFLDEAMEGMEIESESGHKSQLHMRAVGDSGRLEMKK